MKESYRNMKIKRLYKPEDFTMNQLYMFTDYKTLERGFCIEITNDYVRFTYNGEFYKKGYKESLSAGPAYFAEYNSSVFKKFQDLKKYHEQEINELLEANIYTRKEEEGPVKRNNITEKQTEKTIQIFGGLCFLGIICWFIYHLVKFVISCIIKGSII